MALVRRTGRVSELARSSKGEQRALAAGRRVQKSRNGARDKKFVVRGISGRILVLLGCLMNKCEATKKTGIIQVKKIEAIVIQSPVGWRSLGTEKSLLLHCIWKGKG